MKKLVSVALLCIVVVDLFSQNGELAVDLSRFGTPITGASYLSRSITNDLIHEIERINRSKTPEELNEYFLNNIEGTPYLNNEFEKGEVITVDGDILKGVLLRYNIFNNKMEVKEKEILYELSDELIERIKIEDKIFDYLPFQLNKKEYVGYLELIQDGEWKLYCRYTKKFKEAQPQKAMQDKPGHAQFRNLPLVYILKNDEVETAEGFRNKKELLNIFTDHKNEIQYYIKSHKLKHNNPEDLKDLLTYLDSL